MKVPFRGMTDYQGSPTHATLRIEYLTRMEDGLGHAAPGVVDLWAGEADFEDRTWRDDHNRGVTASILVSDPGVPPVPMRLTETFHYADRPAVEQIYERWSTPTDLDGTEHDYTQPQRLFTPAGVPLTFQAAADLIGAGGNVLVQVQGKLLELADTLANIEQSQVDANAAIAGVSRALGYTDLLTDTVNTTAVKLVGGGVAVTLTPSGAGLTVSGGTAGAVSAVTRTGQATATGGVTRLSLTARLDNLGGETPSIGLHFGPAGTARRHILWRSNGQLSMSTDADAIITAIQYATPAWAITAGQTIKFEVIYDPAAQTATVTFTRPDGVTMPYVFTGVPAGAVGFTSRGAGTWLLGPYAQASAPAQLGPYFATPISALVAVNKHPAADWPAPSSNGGAYTVSGGEFSATSTAVSRWGWDIPATGDYAAGKPLSATWEAWQSGANAAQSGVIYYDAAGAELGGTRITRAASTPLSAWFTNSITAAMIPANTVRIRFFFDSQGTSGSPQTAKYRNVVLNKGAVLAPNQIPNASVAPRRVYVSTTGSDLNTGSGGSPFATINAAIQALGSSGDIVVQAGDYRQTVSTSLMTGRVRIMAALDAEVNLLGSTALTMTKTVGRTNVYQASLAAAPPTFGSAAASHNGRVFIRGLPSGLILEADRHPLNAGRTHRLPFCWATAVADLASVDTPSAAGERIGKYWYDTTNKILYMSAPGGADLTNPLYSVEVPSRTAFGGTGAGGEVMLSGINSWFGLLGGFDFAGLKRVERELCRSFGAQIAAFQDDNLQTLHTFMCESAAAGVDGENGHMRTGFASTSLLGGQAVAHYTDSWLHDNGDDGNSYHERGRVSVTGSVSEYNRDRGFAPSYGAHYVMRDTLTQKNGYQNTDGGYFGEGIGVVGNATDGGDGTTVRTINHVSRGDNIAFRAGDDNRNKLEIVRGIAQDWVAAGFQADAGAALIAEDCRYTGTAGTAKVTATAGTITVKTNTALT